MPHSLPVQAKRYSLPYLLSKANDLPLLDDVISEIDGFKTWRVVGINLNRERPVACVEAETFDDNDRTRIMCYLGFAYLPPFFPI
ncbi:ABC transporter ATP-binding [Micractinium conductrix]|uniref:ABC transporter ATP-binding n=1 Tax=Micractinium conductrix TaxID=554055 RepID=A0A2P6V849_9CHLO|nr:ABC transporter ATP-binding [Micractinium conductrix]|eukprot:PSC70259.1 ABC transporter ATP-binding [Micractinium conductrix]